MKHETISKLMEIQYLKGRLDELYKGYVPNNSTTDNRIVDSRISKYEDKLNCILSLLCRKRKCSVLKTKIKRENQKFVGRSITNCL